ncbi:MAG: SPASM domain-containing protein [Cytophagales bacterium]|nr:SPASM domain-containing protein [Cytophaga sp.]
MVNLISKLTFRRIVNILKVWFSYQYSRMTGNVLHPALPFSISIEPTTSCNLRCPECPSGLRSFTRPIGMLDDGMFSKIIHEIYKEVTYLVFYFQGEPYLNPGFLNMVSLASKKGIYTATSTNAHYLSDENARKTIESGLDRLIISIDGTTQETYEQYRIGGNLNKVIEGTKNILRWKKQLKSSTPHVIFQFLVVKPNEHQIEDVKKLAKELGVDEVRFKTAQIYDYEHGSNLIPDSDKYSRYKKNADNTWSIKNSLVNHCWKMWYSCVITWDGRVVPCCFDKDAHYVMGELKEQSFRSVWNSDGYLGFRKSLLKSRNEIEMCKNCTEGTKVWA